MSRVLPILFSTEMVRAILNGRKTVTRRVIKNLDIEENNGIVTLYEKNEDDAFCISPLELAKKEMSAYCQYQPGDILYVRETWTNDKFIFGDGVVRIYRYKADGEEFVNVSGKRIDVLWRPSIHMPKEAARIWLKVTDVRVERLRDIKHDQVLAEGTEEHCKKCDLSSICGNDEPIKGCYGYLWDSTIKKKDITHYGWNANPWVWVIEFERCEKPEGDNR